jgi:dienelactone hydrolase
MRLIKTTAALLLSGFLVASCNNSTDKTTTETKTTETKTPELKAENVTYKIDSLSMNSYIVYDSAIDGKRPAVLVVPEWWGLNEYAKRRARELAGLGYIAMAVDMYGNGQTADNPELAGKLAGPFYQNPAMTKAHFEAALNKLKTYAVVDTANIGAIGYCFGGGVLLNIVRLGEPLKGIVSFHGSLIGTPADKNLLTAKILVLHGDDDKFVPATEVAAFKKQMDSIGAAYTFKSYPGATHAFTNPDATAMGEKFKIPIAYNAAADTASWNEMKIFFTGLFK